MKICFITGKFPPQPDGVGDYTYFMAEELVELGNSIDVITSVTGNSINEGYSYRFRVHRIALRWSVFELPNIIKLIKKITPDVVNIQYVPHAFHPRALSFAVNIIPLLLRIICRNKVKIIVTVHEDYVWSFSSPKLLFLSFWNRFVYLLICWFSHGIVITSKKFEKGVHAINKKYKLIPVCSCIPRIRITDRDIATLRKKLLNGKEGIFLIGTFGNMHPSKDILQIFSLIKRLSEVYNIKFLWIGGRDIENKEEFIKNKLEEYHLQNIVEFTGFQDRESISRLLSAIDIFLLPYSEGVTTRRTSVMAALEHSLPVISTISEFTEDYFKHGGIILVPVNNTENMYNELLLLLKESRRLTSLKIEAENLFKRYFERKIIGLQLLEFMKEIIAI